MLSLVKTDHPSGRVYYRDEAQRLLCFQKTPTWQFDLLLCSEAGEPIGNAPRQLIELDYVPAGDSYTAGQFRAWHQTNTQHNDH
jgi:hypothetical protein